MTIAALIPTFNRPQKTLQAIESVVRQTTPLNEIIVVDDGSNEEHFATLERYCQPFKSQGLKLHRTPAKGVSHARNKGIIEARSEWLAFLDSDDSWAPNKIAIQKKIILNSPKKQWIYSDETWIRNGSEVTKKNHQKKVSSNIFEACLERCFIGASTVLINKTFVEKVGYFNEALPACEDYDLWLRASFLSEPAYVDKELTTRYSGHGDQLSHTVPHLDHWRLESLLQFLDKRRQSLSTGQLEAVINQIDFRSQIVLTGLRRKENFSELASLNSRINLAKRP